MSFLFFQCCCLSVFPQYWQQKVDYSIDVTLQDQEKTLDGFEQITYQNNSPDTLSFIWFHCWPNAYKNDKTAYTDQSLANGNTRFYFSNKEQRGYINRLDFKVNNITAAVEDHPTYADIIRLVLPSPLLPGKAITITTPFHVKLPFNFNRGGYDGENFYIAHWYPKPAVYDKEGWHAMPMLEQGEFYSEFGDYDVQITLPENYAVAATGVLQDETEKEWLQQRAGFTWEPVKEKIKIKGVSKTITHPYPASSTKMKTLHYQQEAVHDFAWFADKRFIVQLDTLVLDNQKTVDCFSFYLPGSPQWKNSLTYIRKSILSKSALIGDYPYSTATIVQNPQPVTGGTEYPTITILNAPTENLLEYTINHEVGHNWFYGMLASNERSFPWMDEGMNSFYDDQYTKDNKEAGRMDAGPLGPINIDMLEDLMLKTRESVKLDQPVNLPSEAYNAINYNLSVYHKASCWMQLLKDKMGAASFNKAMQEYFETWKFKHPYPNDFKQVMEKNTGQTLDSVFNLLGAKGPLNRATDLSTRVAIFPKLRSYGDFIRKPSKNLISIGPAIGVNSYDKVMPGIFITNVKLPPSKFQFFATPMYSTGAKKLNGLAKLNYSLFSDRGLIRRTDIFFNAARFSQNELTDGENRQTILSYTKWVPGLKFTFREKNNQSSIYRYLQLKSYLFQEEQFSFMADTSINGMDTTINFRTSKAKTNRQLVQLKLVLENNRALYPWQANFLAEAGKNFIRLGFTGNYFFNYAKAGGLSVRVFAGKFIYTSPKTTLKQFETDRYHLNMSGPSGYEDYTYSDYFLGRNRYEKLPSQQIMVRDGGFKVRTELLADKVGKTDNWLTAVNLATTIPDHLNPLSVLPIKIPLSIFVDIGSYADAWQKNSNLDRFLYDAGLQVSLYKETINIYFPLFYSAAYKDYIQSVIGTKKFARSISFSINISGFNLRKFNNNFSF